MGTQPTPTPKNLSSVSITVQINSTASGPPYMASGITGQVNFSNAQPQPFSGWGLEQLGVVPANGANLTLLVQDLGYSSYPTGTYNVQMVGWILTFLPRQGTSQPSPIAGNRQLSWTQAFSSVNGVFTLIDPNTQSGNTNLLKNTGFWDWSLMMQLQIPNSDGTATTKTFVSDPEMEMDG